MNLCLAELGNARLCTLTNLYKVVCVHLKILSMHVMLERTLWAKSVLGRETAGVERATSHAAPGSRVGTQRHREAEGPSHGLPAPLLVPRTSFS